MFLEKMKRGKIAQTLGITAFKNTQNHIPLTTLLGGSFLLLNYYHTTT